MTVSCSIVCYQNAPRDIGPLLESIACSRIAVRVYLVENSADPHLAQLAASTHARYIHLPHNPGYGAGHNTAMREAMTNGCRYHFILNPDVRFPIGALETLVDYLDAHEGVGMVAPRVQYPDGRPQHLCKLLPHPLDLLVRRFFPFVHRFSGREDHYELRRSGYDRIMPVPALSGCFMLLRMSVMRQIGLFDERFFMYLEDVDLTRRIGAVAQTIYYPHVCITHAYARGSYTSLRLTGHHVRSAVRYFNKWGWRRDPQRDRVNRAALQQIFPGFDGAA